MAFAGSANLRLLGQDPLRLSIIGAPTSLASAIVRLLSVAEDGGLNGGFHCEVHSHLTILDAEKIIQTKTLGSDKVDRPDVILFALGRDDAKRRTGDGVLRTAASVFNERLAVILEQARGLGATVLWLLLPESGPLFDDSVDESTPPRSHRATASNEEEVQFAEHAVQPASTAGAVESRTATGPGASGDSSAEQWLPPRPNDVALYTVIAKNVCWKLGVETVDLVTVTQSLFRDGSSHSSDDEDNNSAAQSPRASISGRSSFGKGSPSAGFDVPGFSSVAAATSPGAGSRGRTMRRMQQQQQQQPYHSYSYSHGLDRLDDASSPTGERRPHHHKQKRSLSFASRLDYAAGGGTTADGNGDDTTNNNNRTDKSTSSSLPFVVRFKKDKDKMETDEDGQTPSESADDGASSTAPAPGTVAAVTSPSARHSHSHSHHHRNHRQHYRDESQHEDAEGFHLPSMLLHKQQQHHVGDHSRQKQHQSHKRRQQQRLASALASFVGGRVSALEADIRGLMGDSDGTRWPWLVPLVPRSWLEKLPRTWKRYQGLALTAVGLSVGFYLGYRYSRSRMSLTRTMAEQSVMALLATGAAAASSAAATVAGMVSGSAAGDFRSLAPAASLTGTAADLSLPFLLRFASSPEAAIAAQRSRALAFVTLQQRIEDAARAGAVKIAGDVAAAASAVAESAASGMSDAGK